MLTGESPIASVRHGESAWQHAVVYQIYPRSFKDSNADGIGDIPGIVSKLDYLKDLGVNAVWVSPIFRSPMIDGGYDVTDHTDIDPCYGNIDDFSELVAKAHEQNLKVIIDLIPNHTSDQHPWFVQSRSSQDSDNPKRDWYIWRDPAPDGGPPNNWASVFSKPQLQAYKEGRLAVPAGEPIPPLPAWTYDETRKQYYLHSFSEQQPDLNWQNHEVREAIKDVMRFWIGRGVDGFRADAVNYLGKDPSFTDEARDPNYKDGIDNPYDQLARYHSTGYAESLHVYLNELTTVLVEYPDRDLRIVYEDRSPEADLAMIDQLDPSHASSFNFARLKAPWDAPTHKALLDRYYASLPASAVANQVNGNHDEPRLASRLGEQRARAAAFINLMLPGMIFIYNGEEGGFTNVKIPEEKLDDKLGRRDEARTPMPWTDAFNAGFSDAPESQLCLPVDPDYVQINIENQLNDPTSSLALYRALIEFRKLSKILQLGYYAPLLTDNRQVLAFARRHKGRQLITLTNFSKRSELVRVSRTLQGIGRVIISSTMLSQSGVAEPEKGLELRPNESILISSTS